MLPLDTNHESRYSFNMKNQTAEQLKEDRIFTARIRNADFTFHTLWGMFSPKGIDEGTYLLHHSMHVEPTDTILDLGCGYGALGIPLAKDVTEGSVDMVDANFKAVELANKNISVAGITNAKAFLSYGFSEIPEDKKYSVIVSNLPANVGREMLFIMLSDAREHLVEGGTIYVVTIAGLRQFIKSNFEKVFGNYEKVSQERGYTVAKAVKS